jgi:ketosteroid isomerase-like protein
MQKIVMLFALLISLAGLAGAARAQKDDAFSRFFADFQAAVKAGDKEKVASMTSFDDFYWESNDALRQVKTKEDFLKNYDKMFTPAIKAKIATGTPKRNDQGDYFIIWHTKDLEYGINFDRGKDGSYKFHGHTVGPY